MTQAKGGRRHDPARKAEALRLYGSGATVEEIRMRFGINPSTVFRWARDAGMPPRQNQMRHSQDLREAVLADLRQGATAADCSRKHRIGEATARNWAHAERIRLIHPGRPVASPEKMAEAVALCRAGRSIAQISAALGITYWTAKRWTRTTRGLPPRRVAAVRLESDLAFRLDAAARSRGQAPKDLAHRILAAVLTPDARGRDMIDNILEDA